jgi:hypothetical protein
MSLVHRKKTPKSQRPPTKAEMKRATIKTLRQIIDDPDTKPAKRLTAIKKFEKLCPEKPKGRPRGKPFAAKPEPAPVEAPAAPESAENLAQPSPQEGDPPSGDGAAPPE